MTDVQALTARLDKLERLVDEIDARVAALVDNVNALRNPPQKRKPAAAVEGQ